MLFIVFFLIPIWKKWVNAIEKKFIVKGLIKKKNQDLPTSEDRDLLLELLPTNLPIKLMIKKIPYEFYWERAAKDRWEFNNLVEHGNSWRQLYCERHFSEYLESLDITYFDVEQEACEEAIQLLRDFIYTLKIHCLVATEYPLKLSGKENDESHAETEFPVQHIPMNIILPRLSNLRELVINFGMIYFNDGFEWKDFQFSVEDCRNLGRGIKDCFCLKKFHLTKSNLDQPRVAALLQEMSVNNSLEEIDFSHCKLEDNGAQAIGLFLTMHKRLEILHLANNKIGPVGVAGIVYGLLEENSVPLKNLNLRLNPLQNEGGMQICSILLRHARLEVLNISGCGLGPETGIEMAEVIASGHMKSSSMELDVSNNDFGPIVGERFDKSLKMCSIIVEFDSRLCNFNNESQYSISQTVFRNKMQKGKDKKKMFLSTCNSSISNISSLILKSRSLISIKKYDSIMELSSSSTNDDDNNKNNDHELSESSTKDVAEEDMGSNAFQEWRQADYE
ncbi:dynein regulatory complex subunit 5 isoform X2 [Leptopilina boulardi]|uniref:dynein regulatory complex subunit 5 isoform X2 n=1 Tax=Leptopilina boulardi TaxID=63433 RepID=UPI0021F51726|nr:dynein regulatory complex subunit 5 isoform X2 [Leptopilina boulardi]